jgi:hypothetical protein
LNPLGPAGYIVRRQFLFLNQLLEMLSHCALDALAGNTRPAGASKKSVLWSAGIIAVQVGRSKILDHVNLDNSFHLLSFFR